MSLIEKYSIVYGSKYHDGLVFDTNVADWTKELITPNVINPEGRGVHISCNGAAKVCPVMWRGLGYVDIDYELALAIKLHFNIECLITCRDNTFIFRNGQ